MAKQEEDEDKEADEEDGIDEHEQEPDKHVDVEEDCLHRVHFRQQIKAASNGHEGTKGMR